MKITANTNLPQPSKSPGQPTSAAPNPDLRRKKPANRNPPRRRNRVHLKKDASVKRAGPDTPLLRWNFEGDKSSKVSAEGTVSVRKLAAALCRLQPPEVAATPKRPRSINEEYHRLGFQQHTSHVGERLSSNHGSKGFGSEARSQPRSPCSVNGPKNGYTNEPQASFKFSNFDREGATKWDPVCPEKNEETSSFHFCNQNQNSVLKVSSLQLELEQARTRIEELELEQRSSKKKLKQFLLKLSEERAAWRSREHEKVRSIISDVKADLIRERKNSQRLEVVNSKLVNELAGVKSAMKRYMQEFEKERKNRELVEEVCDELANEIGEDKAEAEALKTECMKMREEVDDERKMLQMAEVWREERVQMKLIDAKVTLEDKYSQMNRLIADLKLYLGSKDGSLDTSEIKEAELLQQAAASVKIHDITEFTYEPPKSDDIFSIFEEMGMGDDMDDDRSGWETVSQTGDQGSSFTPEGSITSLNGGDETPVTEISGVSSSRSRNLKKMSAISRLWKSGHTNGESYRIVSMDGRLSNGGSCFMSPDNGCRQWSSPDTGIQQMDRGRKSCMEWPRGQKNSLKAKLLEARVESQKIQLRQVLKQNT